VPRPDKPANTRLRAALDEAGMSNKGLARRVVDLAATRGVSGVRCDHTSVLRWLAGEQPRPPVPDLVAAVLGRADGLADQEAGHPLGFVNPAIYQIARGTLYHKAFHDITAGNNTATYNGVTITGYQAAPGWDPITGWGTPDAQVLIPLLAR
jgi:hypothetical protein